MVSNSRIHPDDPSRLAFRRRPRLLPRRGPLRPGLIAFWLLAGVALPVASVAGVLSLIGPLGYAGALALVALVDAALLAAAASATGPARARTRAVGGLVLTVVITWGVLAVAFVTTVSSCHGCLS
jgi:nitrate reductase NapE component